MASNGKRAPARNPANEAPNTGADPDESTREADVIEVGPAAEYLDPIKETVDEAVSQMNDADVELVHIEFALKTIVDLTMVGGEDVKQQIDAVASLAKAYLSKLHEMNAEAMGTVHAITHIYADEMAEVRHHG